MATYPNTESASDVWSLRDVYKAEASGEWPSSPSELYVFTDATFTPGTSTGTTGPSLAEAIAGLSSTGDDSWKNNTSFFDVSSGIQLWTVPETASYQITCAGAQGGESGDGAKTGGNGAEMQGTLSLTQGQQLKILVGQSGEQGDNTGGAAGGGGGGGGGSFVTLSDNTILVIAGGGGGADNSAGSGNVGGSGLTTENGGDGDTGTGGTSGGGGSGGNSGTGSSGGGGYSGDGSGASAGGTSFLNGGTGGTNGVYGGFGGGAGSEADLAGGGGGGYSGGGGGKDASTSGGGGGGGGSLNNGTNQTNTAGANSGNGFVTITKL